MKTAKTVQYAFAIALKDSNCGDRYIGFNSKKMAISAFDSFTNRPCVDTNSTELLKGCFTLIAGGMGLHVLSKHVETLYFDENTYVPEDNDYDYNEPVIDWDDYMEDDYAPESSIDDIFIEYRDGDYYLV